MEFLLELVTSFGIQLLGALVVAVIGWRVVRWFRKWMATTKRLDKLEPGVRSFFVSFATIALYAILFITVAMMIGVPATSFITILASCGVAIGLALQGSLSNVAGGLMILLFKPFRVGDYIEVAGESGTVTDISVVYTVLRTPDNRVITVPNGIASNSVVENYSTEATRRVDINVKVAPGTDVDKVNAVLLKAARTCTQVQSSPEPFARLSAQEDHVLVFTLRVWCDTAVYWDVWFDLTEAVRKAFEANGISVPRPQLDVRVDGKERVDK